MTLFETTIISEAGLVRDGAAAKAAQTRANIITMSQAAEDAVLRPSDCGAFGHDLRAALAGRVARLAANEPLAAHYLVDAGDQAFLAGPNQTGADQGLTSVLNFVDKVAIHTRDVAAEDITELQGAGICDADIVRLCELVAFLAYQIRVIAGLRLMQGVAA